jgi:tryptophanyl-tRNA synthetase
MSKSRRNAIAIAASADETAQLIRSAKTDPDRHITDEPTGRPAVSNLRNSRSRVTGFASRTVASGFGAPPRRHRVTMIRGEFADASGRVRQRKATSTALRTIRMHKVT